MFSPVHLAPLTNAARESGRSFTPRRWFEVDAALLDPARTVIYLPITGPEGMNPPRSADYLPFGMLTLTRNATPSTTTLSRLRDPSQRLVWFLDVPHILYRGVLKVRHLSVIEI